MTQSSWERVGGEGNLTLREGIGIGTLDPGSYKLKVEGGDTSLDGTLTVAGATTLQDALDVSGATSLNGTTSVGATLAVAEATTLNGALTVSGATSLNGNVGISTDSPKAKLHVNGGTDVDLGTEKSGYLILGNAAGQHIAIDNNEIMSKKTGTTESILSIQYQGGETRFGGKVGIGPTEPGTYKLKVAGSLSAEATTLSSLTVTGAGVSSFAGNVGIGTDEPGTYRLKVEGGFQASSIFSKPRMSMFKVEGTNDKFYPVVFRDDNWEDGPMILEITRPNIHTDARWKGALNSKFTCHSTSWGHGADFCRAEIYYSRPESVTGRPEFIAGYQNHSKAKLFIVWLRGQTTYQWRSNQFVTLVDYEATQKSLPSDATNPDAVQSFPIKDAIEPYVQSGIHFDKNLVVDGAVKIGSWVIVEDEGELKFKKGGKVIRFNADTGIMVNDKEVIKDDDGIYIKQGANWLNGTTSGDNEHPTRFHQWTYWRKQHDGDSNLTIQTR